MNLPLWLTGETEALRSARSRLVTSRRVRIWLQMRRRDPDYRAAEAAKRREERAMRRMA